jgi:hypothetical protein
MSLGINDIRAIIRASVSIGGTTVKDKLTTERNALALDLIDNPEAGKEIISGSGNGVSMNASVSYTKSQRIAFLDRALFYIENSVWPSSTSWARFGGGGNEVQS